MDFQSFYLQRFRADVGFIPEGLRHQLAMIADKDAQYRTLADLKNMDYLTGSISFFVGLTSKQRYSLFKVINYERVGKREIIFKQGQVGDNFYIVLCGSVEVKILEPHTNTMKIIGRLYPGQHFGELALQEEGGGLRKATVETADDCEFLTIDIASYQSSMEEITAQRNEAKAAFFSRLPLFEPFSDEELLHLSKYFYTTNFRPGDIIVQQGDHAESIMFLTKGRCRVIRVLDLTTVILPVEVGELGPYEMFGDAPLCTSKHSQKRRNHSPHSASTAQSSPATRIPISHAEASPNADGHTEQLHGDHYRPLTCSVLANTNVEVLCINRSDFVLHILSGGNNKDTYRTQTSPFTDTDYELLRSLQENTNDEVFKQSCLTEIMAMQRKNPLKSNNPGLPELVEATSQHKTMYKQSKHLSANIKRATMRLQPKDPKQEGDEIRTPTRPAKRDLKKGKTRFVGRGAQIITQLQLPNFTKKND